MPRWCAVAGRGAPEFDHPSGGRRRGFPQPGQVQQEVGGEERLRGPLRPTQNSHLFWYTSPSLSCVVLVYATARVCVVCGVWCVVHTVCRSLSFCDPGLLNAIDGIASQEGRLFVMTTNHMEHLDPGMASSDFPAEWPSTTHPTHTTHDTRHTPHARAHSADTTWTRGQGGPLRAGFHAASRAHVPAVRASCAPPPQSSVGDGPVRAV